MPSDASHSSQPKRKTNRSRFGRLMGVQIVGVGSYAPPAASSATKTLPRWAATPSGSCSGPASSNGGTRTPAMATSDLAVEAARRCIERRRRRSADDIDLVLVGTYTPDLLMPATASLVQDRPRAVAPRRWTCRRPAPASSSPCSRGMQFVATGCSRLAFWSIGADCNSRVVNPADEQTYPLFGDAAGAVAAGRRQRRARAAGLRRRLRRLGRAAALPADGRHRDCRSRPSRHLNGRHYLHMDGRPVFKWAIRMLRETIDEVLQAAGMTLDDVDLVIFHQANMRIINSAVGRAGHRPARKSSTTSTATATPPSASIPLALDEAYRARPHPPRQPHPLQRLRRRAGLGHGADAVVSEAGTIDFRLQISDVRLDDGRPECRGTFHPQPRKSTI